MSVEVVLGIDLGTQGGRILAVDRVGQVVASAHEPLALQAQSLPPGWFEQNPHDWWQVVKTCLNQLLARLPPAAQIAGIGVDSTSATILPIDRRGEPLSPAVMYNDQRSEAQVPLVREAGKELQDQLGYVFGSSFALPKILWFKQMRPQVFDRADRFIHAADFIVGRLTGMYGATDTSNALKTGYDLIGSTWPVFIEQSLQIPLEKLPEVQRLGSRIGSVDPRAAGETGLPAGIPVFAGSTDGTAAQIASGAVQPGDWNSTLGTTLVLKGISTELKSDPLGRLYFHRHPDGFWMPGGASNTGTEWIVQDHPGANLTELDALAHQRIPTRLVRYPLGRQGERFPFIQPEAVGFLLGTPLDEIDRYAAGLEGLAMLERLSYDTVRAIGLEDGARIYTTGGGSNSTRLVPGASLHAEENPGAPADR